MDDYLSNSAKNHEARPTSDHPDHRPDHKPSNSELLKSAKLVAEAAQAHFHHEPEKYDKGQVAGAAANLLDAAGEYGKLDDKGIGKYLDQAEDYLRKYGNSTSHQNAAVHNDSGETKTTNVGSPEKKKSDHGEGGAGDYIKMAQGFLQKPSDGGEGGFMKMAGDFLKK